MFLNDLFSLSSIILYVEYFMEQLNSPVMILCPERLAGNLSVERVKSEFQKELLLWLFHYQSST